MMASRRAHHTRSSGSVPISEESLRRGRTKESGKQGRKKSGKKALAFVAAIRERRNGIPVEQRNPIKKARKKERSALKPLDNKSPIQGRIHDCTRTFR
jgi:hypothetical protein